MLALEDVNSREDILPGYKLNLTWSDSKCEPGLGATVMYDLLYNPPQKLILLGGCSTVCTTIAEAAKMWNLVVLSYGSSSPALSDRSRFPTFFRTHPSATVHNPTRIRLFQKFSWSKIAILQQAEEVFISTVEDLEMRCKDARIEILTRQSFLTDPSDALRNLKRQDARIIVGLFYVQAGRRVLCEIYKQNLYGKSYVWFLIGWYEDNWYKLNLKEEKLPCTEEEMMIAAEGHITTEALMWNQDNQKTISGMTTEDFSIRLNEALKNASYDVDNNQYPEGYQEAPLAYDAIWATALALNKTMFQLKGQGKNIETFTYNNKEIADQIYSAMNSTQFLGVSGSLAFSAKGDRIAWTQVEQMIDGVYYKLGYYDTHTDNLTWLNREKWSGGKPPPDRTIVKNVLKTVSLGLLISMCTTSLIGIIWAVSLLLFNSYYKCRRLIRLSQPVCNNLTLVGVIFCLTGVCLLGLDGRLVSDSMLPMVCQARVWILCIGFSLAYGAMFSKIWCVHTLSTKHKAEGKVKVNMVTDKPGRPWLMVGTFIVLDVLVLTTWQIVDPLKRTLQFFPLETPEDVDEDIRIRPQLEHCESENNTIWLGIIYSYKGLLLVFGLFLAYETRSVKVKMINDSRYVGMAIYNVVVLCVITAPVSLVIASQPDASFAFVSLATIFCCLLSMALIFVPKVIEVINQSGERTESRNYTSSHPTKEDEDRYKKLLSENEDLQRKIAETDEQIRLLKLKIEERKAIQASSDKEKEAKPEVELEKDSNDNTQMHEQFIPEKFQISNMDIDNCSKIDQTEAIRDAITAQNKFIIPNKALDMPPEIACFHAALQDFELTESYL